MVSKYMGYMSGAPRNGQGRCPGKKGLFCACVICGDFRLPSRGIIYAVGYSSFYVLCEVGDKFGC